MTDSATPDHIRRLETEIERRLAVRFNVLRVEFDRIRLETDRRW